MSATITLALANAYFAPTNHIHSKLWTDSEEKTRAACLAMARRIVTRALTDVYDDEDDVASTDAVAYGYAVYEQALYILIGQGVGNAEGTVPGWPAQGPDADEKSARQFNPEVLCRECRLWLGIDSQNVVCRNA
jgi:hypothetical protein